MMMAPDSTPLPPGELDDETLAKVRAAMAEFCRSPLEEPRSLRQALTRVASEARSRNILAEQLLVTLKGVWSSLPEIHHASAADRALLLQRIITICIHEYYAVR